MKPSIPVYARLPNNLLRYELRERICDGGHAYTERVAIYLNKDREQCEMTAQIIWGDITHNS